jgi:hypothetical protein
MFLKLRVNISGVQTLLSMKKIDLIVNTLWKEHLPLIKVGLPIYFTYTGDSLRKIFFEANLDTEDPILDIFEAVKGYILVDSDSAYILDSAFERNEQGFSKVILFICQQVLVVEEMVRSNDFGPNAYFPRYREMLSEQLSDKSLSPFDYDDFEKLWQTLANEIKGAGGSSNSITFQFGKKQGPSQAKRFPLSQALLSKDDIAKLISLLGRSNLNGLSREELYNRARLRENIRVISSRGKSLFKQPALREELINQIQSFLNSDIDFEYFLEEAKKLKVDISEYALKAYIDPTDWFETSYVLNLFNEIGDPVIDKTTISNYFSNLKLSFDYYILTPSDCSESWLFRDQTYSPKLNDEILIVFSESEIENIRSIINRSININVNNTDVLTFSRVFKSSFFKITVTDEVLKLINISNSRFGDPLANSDCLEVRFQGGITVNKRSDVFNKEDLPEKILIGGEIKNIDRKIMVEGRVTTYQKFKNDCLLLERDESFNIQLEDGSRFTIKVSSGNPISSKQYGFILSDKIPLPLVTEISDEVRSSISDIAEISQKLRMLRDEGKLKELYDFLSEYQLS